MNVTITESDRRMLSILAAFVLAAAYFFLVFRPLSERNSQLQKEITQVKEQENAMNISASLAEEVIAQEQQAREELDNILLCFYPMLQSQEAENMLTVLMLNHNLQIQNMSITAESTPSELNWYQYSSRATQEMTADEQARAEEENAAIIDDFGIYTIRITCAAEGSRQNLMAFVDDISLNYPSISILGTEWSNEEKPARTAAEENLAEEGVETPAASVAGTTGLTISVEVYMYHE